MEMELNEDVLSLLLESYNNDKEHLQRVLQSLCQPPLFSTLRINLQLLDMKAAVDKLQEYFKEQCCKANTECYTIYPHPFVPDCVIIENRGPCPVEELSVSVIVDLACGMAVLRGADVFVQGIMGAPKGMQKDDVVSVYADLDGKCLKGFAGDYCGHKLFVGNGKSAVTRSDLFSKDGLMRGLGISMTQPLYEAPSLSDLPFDWAFPQNLPSIACVHALNPQPGETILDMCAAPGGKTSHIAALMKKTGPLFALEKSNGRTEKMKTMLDQLRMKNVQCFQYDAIKACSVTQKGAPVNPPFPPAMFNRILLDAPCSGLGQRPSRINKISLNQLKSFPVMQEKLLNTAVQLLEPGGTLVYSTCTICREENEDQVAKLLKTCPSIELVDIPFRLGGPGLPTAGLTPEQCTKVQRFDPSILLTPDKPVTQVYNIDTIGFFIAKFRKKTETENSLHVGGQLSSSSFSSTNVPSSKFCSKSEEVSFQLSSNAASSNVTDKADSLEVDFVTDMDVCVERKVCQTVDPMDFSPVPEMPEGNL